MNEREREICSRLKELRERLKWPQQAFADQLGITHNQLASIEYSRTPLRYSIAWKAKGFFGVSLNWLVTPGPLVDPFGRDLDAWPNPDRLKNQAVLLSEIEQSLYSSTATKPIAEDILNARLDPPNKKPSEIRHRAALFTEIANTLFAAMARIPDGNALDFFQKINKAIGDCQRTFKNVPKQTSDRRLDDLAWEINRIEVARRLLRKEYGASHLTETSTRRNFPSVKSEWTVLKRRLQDVAAKPGAKTKLAKFLGLDLTRVSQWLTDSQNAREPGAEYALKMLRWVEQQERQK